MAKMKGWSMRNMTHRLDSATTPVARRLSAFFIDAYKSFM
jgi:hypothetical protein